MKTQALCVLAMFAVLGVAQAATFSAANVVADLAACPVKNVLFKASEFDVASLADMLTVMQEQGVSQKCQDAAQTEDGLMMCINDGPDMEKEPNLVSLGIKTGCCTKKCADAVNAAHKSGCQDEYIKAVCSKPEYIQKYASGMLSAGERCAGLSGSCPGQANATAAAPPKAGAANATAPAGGMVLPESTEAGAAPSPASDASAENSPAPAATASPAPAQPSSAASAVFSGALLVAAGAAALVL